MKLRLTPLPDQVARTVNPAGREPESASRRNGQARASADFSKRHGGAEVAALGMRIGPLWMLAMAALLLLAPCGRAQGSYRFGSGPVGVVEGEQTVTVTAQRAGVVQSVEILTLGAGGLDFRKGADTLDCESATLAARAVCKESVIFTPAAPGLRIGAVVLLGTTLEGAGSQLLGTAYLSGVGTGGLGVLVGGNILPVAGDGAYLGAIGDGGPALEAELNHPSSVVLDGAGNMYIADKYHHRIREVSASTGLISAIAGNDNPAYTGDGGPATAATLNTPWGLALDGAGNLYIADTGNNVVRRIAASTGIISTVAGNGRAGFAGDGAAATAAELNNPQGVSLDGAGKLYIADTYNHRVRVVDPVSGVITTIAGNGFTNPNGSGGYGGDGGAATQAKLDFPFAVAFDLAGNMYIPDSGNNAVRKVDLAGNISTFAGTGTAGFSGDGAAAASALLWAPSGVTSDPAGNVYIADTQNNSIRKVSAATGFISTIAADAAGEFYFRGNFSQVSIYGPIGLYLDASGDLYFADTLNMRIREIQANYLGIDYTATPVRQGDQSAVTPETVENDGNAALDLTGVVPDKNAAVDPATTTCEASDSLSQDVNCVVGVIFAPSAAGDPLAGNIDVRAEAMVLPLDIQPVGNATPVNSTSVSLTSNPEPSNFGQTVTFTATVKTGTGTPTGTVTFLDGTTPLGTPVPLRGSAEATLATPALSVGLHTISVTYSGDATHFPVPSPSYPSPIMTQAVWEATEVYVSSNVNPAAVGQNVTFTAAVDSDGGGGVVPQGMVIFSDGATILGSATLNASGVATLATTTPLSDGLHVIVATYGGDSGKQVRGSTSAFFWQDIQASATAQLGISGIQGSGSHVVFYGNPVTFGVSVTGSGTTPTTGKVLLMDGAQPLGMATLVGNTGQTTFTTSSLAVGEHIFTAVYQGDSDYGPSQPSAAIALNVEQAGTSTGVSAHPNPGIAGASMALTATVKVVLGISTPTGLVSFSDGARVLGSAQAGTNGAATVNVFLAPGQHSISAAYGGDKNDSASASAPPLTLTVELATTSIAVRSSLNPSITDSPVSFTAKVAGNGGTPSGTVTFFSDGVSIGTGKLDATGTASCTTDGLAAGVHSITASYGGDVNDAASTSGSPSLSQTVGTIPTVTALGTSTTGGVTPQPMFVATVLGASGPTPTGTVTFSVGSTVLGAAPLNATGVASVTPNLGAGPYSVVAAYGGDASHSASSSQPVSVTGTPIGFDIVLNPASLTLATTQNAVVTVAIASASGFADKVGLGCASLPAGVTCHFANPSVTLKSGATETAQLTIDTDNPLTGGSSAKLESAGNRSTFMAGIFLPLGLLFGCIFWRLRRRNGGFRRILLSLALFCAALLATACSSGFTQTSAAPGSYVIQIVGTGVNSNIVQYQSLTLNINK